MRTMFTLFIILVFAETYSQVRERLVSGRLTANDGSPLQGVNVVIKGTAVGTVTNADGYYALDAPIGSILIFSFVGMQAREVMVTEESLKPVKASPENSFRKKKLSAQPSWSALMARDTAVKQKGVTVLSNETPVYFHKGENINPADIAAIRPVGRIRASLRGGRKVSGGYVIKTNSEPVYTGFGLHYTSAIGIENITQLPDLQKRFSQGRSVSGSLRWQGAEAAENLSWGPLMRTLEFDGSNYPYDLNGKLVQAGTGNGKPSKIYDAVSFFKTGLNVENNLLLSTRGPAYSTMIIDAGRKTRSGVIPNSNYQRNNFSIQLKRFKFSQRLQGDAMATYNISEGKLMNRGANLATILAAVYNTPASFDNTNALSVRSASKSINSYRTPDGNIRSYAPGYADNPFGLINEMPDHEKWKRMLATGSLRYSAPSDFKLTVNGSLDKQWNDVMFGLVPGSAGYTRGRLTRRNENETYFNTIITPAYSTYRSGTEIEANISYQFNYQQRALERQDGFGYQEQSFNKITSADALLSITKIRDRRIHETLFNLQFKRYWFNARLANRAYFSNTLAPANYTNIFPTLSLNVNLAQVTEIYPIDVLKVYGSFSRTLHEAPLVYSSWTHSSTQYETSDYNRYFESAEIYLPKNILPETERKFETGIESWISGRFQLELTYFDNVTEDLIAPVMTGNQFDLSNVARLKNYGATATASYNNYNYPVRWGISLRWSKYNSIVTKLYSSSDYVPLAGFSNNAAVLAENAPAGAIYGTVYLRDVKGKMIIGDDGFPLMDPSLKMIGNPIPDWTMGLDGNVSWNGFRLSMLFDTRKGGEVWNGTQAALDFSGRSEKTARERTNSGYVFEGVNLSNQPNTNPVNFYDPADPVEKNRWVRYGFSGVAEDYIEDASWLRLSELTMSYTTKMRRSKIKEFRFSLIGRNLFLFTPYTGVDPATSLFGYSGAAGLDLFNSPSTRSYSVQVSIKI